MHITVSLNVELHVYKSTACRSDFSFV